MPTATSAKPALKYITINDFTPGIADNVGYKWPTGQATSATFGCRANQSGALIPGPKLIRTIPGTDWALPPTLTPGYMIVGLYATGPLVASGGGHTTSANPWEIYLVTEWGRGAATKEVRFERLRIFEVGEPRDVIKSITQAASGSVTGTWGVSIHETRMNRTTPTSPGVPVVIFSWGDFDGDSLVFEFPDDAAPTTLSTFTAQVATAVSVTHQGRIVIGIVTAYGRGNNASWSTTEDLKWSAPNDPTPANFTVTQVFYPERTDGYTAMASMSANELFLLKQSNAVMVSGDLSNPTVINLPMVAGSGNAGLKPTRSRIGLIYGNEIGIWQWAHGDASQRLSPNLAISFWLNPSAAPQLAIQYQFHAEANFIFVSNNYYLDSDTNGWWRLTNPNSASYRYMTGYLNHTYAAYDYYTPGNLNAIDEYDLDIPAVHYSWSSHPFRETMDRRIDVEELAIRANGAGSITFQFLDQTGAVVSTKVITLTSSTYPRLYRANLPKFQSEGMSLVITADNGSSAAPTLYEVNIGYQEAQLAKAT